MATNDLKVVYGTVKTLEASGASVANNVIAQANDADWSSTDTADFPHATFALSVTFSVAPTENAGIDLVLRRMNVDGTNDELAPEATRLVHYEATFVVDNITTIQYMAEDVLKVPKEGQAWIYNNATGQTISAGWTLKMTPFSYAPT